MHHILNDILKETGITKTQLANDLEISRSYGLALLKGERPLTEAVFQKLKTLEYVSEKHIGEISDLFIKNKYSDKYFKLVEYFFDEGKAFSFDAEETYIAPFELNDSAQNLDEDSIVFAACSVLKEAMEKGDKVYTNYPFSFKSLDDALYATYKREYDPNTSVIEHIVAFSGVVDKSSILSLWKSFRWGSLRVPAKAVVMESQGTIMPYYFVSSERVLLFSFDKSCGTVVSSKALAESYISEHQKLSDASHDLFYIIEDESQLLTSRSDFIDASVDFEILTFIYPIAICDYDLLYRNTTDIPHELKDSLIKAYLNYYDFAKSYCSTTPIYTSNALNDFMKNGLVHIVSEKYLNAFSIEDRKIAIKISAETSLPLILKDDTITLPEHFSFEVTDKFIAFHFILSYPGHTDYELYATIKRDSYKDMDAFLSAMGDYVRSDSRLLSDSQTKFKLKQLYLTGPLYEDLN